MKPLGSRLGASWGLFLSLLGPSRGASRGPLGLSWGPLGAFWGPLGAEGSNCRFVVPLLGPSWGRLGTLLGDLGRLLGRLEALLDRLGALLGASWAVMVGLEGLWGHLGASEARTRENATHIERHKEHH